MWVVELGVIPCVKPGLHPQIASRAGHPLPWAPALSPRGLCMEHLRKL